MQRPQEGLERILDPNCNRRLKALPSCRTRFKHAGHFLETLVSADTRNLRPEGHAALLAVELLWFRLYYQVVRLRARRVPEPFHATGGSSGGAANLRHFRS